MELPIIFTMALMIKKSKKPLEITLETISDFFDKITEENFTLSEFYLEELLKFQNSLTNFNLVEETESCEEEDFIF